MFYADVPIHEWRLFGSWADHSNDEKSDMDVMLCGVTRKDLDHPYFVDTLARLRQFSIEEGRNLDLFLDMPEANRIEAIFSPKERAIDAGPLIYQSIKGLSVPMMPQELFHMAFFSSQQERQPITSREEFEQRQLAKLRKHCKLEPEPELPPSSLDPLSSLAR